MLHVSLQSPQVSDQINMILVSMSEESYEERANLSDIIMLSQQHTTEVSSNHEIDELVTYVMGPEAEVRK